MLTLYGPVQLRCQVGAVVCYTFNKFTGSCNILPRSVVLAYLYEVGTYSMYKLSWILKNSLNKKNGDDSRERHLS